MKLEAPPLAQMFKQIPMPEAIRVRGLTWALTIGAAVMLALASVLMFLLILATNNQTRFEHYYERLYYVNLGVAALLLLVILWVAWRLVLRFRRGRFGSRLLLKLAAIFALVGLLPGLLIYFVSYQFVSRSIESWFNVQVEGALDAGLNLGRITIETQSKELAQRVKTVAEQLSVSEFSGPLTLERLREQMAASDVLLWNVNGQLIASSGASRFVLSPERPTSAQLKQVRSEKTLSQVEGLDESGTAKLKVLALVAPQNSVLNLPNPSNEVRFLQVIAPISSNLVTNALAVQEAYKQYQERALARKGLRDMYIGTLTLALFLAIFGAILLAILLGNQLVRPLLVLADGVARVAAGDLTPKAALQTKDELGGLTRSFAQMTQQLSDARSQLNSSVNDLDAARAHLQTILDNLTAGVMVLDSDLNIVQINPGATRVLRTPLAAFIGQPLASVSNLSEFARQIAEQFKHTQQEGVSMPDHWQHAFDLSPNDTALTADRAIMPGASHATSLMARGAALPGNLRLVVLDDITEIVSAQRSRAWGEVARRLAHEIKNPLTPIQLSAERLEMKLHDKLQGNDQSLLARSVKMIVDQVDAMKRLVNEFRDYARLPTAQLQPLDLNELINDVLALYAPENSAVPLKIELDLACPKIAGDAQQLRQVIHNLLQNAQDACLSAAQNSLDKPLDILKMGAIADSKKADVTIQTRYKPTSNRVQLRVLDEGAGFAPHILQRAFEPYVTTKDRGTGLGLAVVKKIADEHNARIEIKNRMVEIPESVETPHNLEKTLGEQIGGAQVTLSFPVV